MVLCQGPGASRQRAIETGPRKENTNKILIFLTKLIQAGVAKAKARSLRTLRGQVAALFCLRENYRAFRFFTNARTIQGR